MKANNWLKLFKKDFKRGDEVIVILDDDRFDWGTLDWDVKKIKLIKGKNKRGENKGHEYEWTQVVFVCHDGFPVRKLKGADGSESALRNIPTNIIEAIRTALNEENYEKEKKIDKLIDFYDLHLGIEKLFSYLNSQKKIGNLPEFVPKLTRPQCFGFGDPFLIEDVDMKLFNLGNGGPAFWDHPLIETLVCKSVDGAVAHFWDLQEIFFTE